jgi:hypothetical protein
MSVRWLRFLAMFLLYVAPIEAKAEPLRITSGSVLLTSDELSLWRISGPEFSFDSGSDFDVGQFRCGAEPALIVPCLAGESIAPLMLQPGSGLGGSVGSVPLTFRGNEVTGTVSIDSIEGSLLLIPHAAAPFTLTSQFLAMGFLRIDEFFGGGGSSEDFPLVGAGTATMNFVPDPSFPNSFRLTAVDLQFGDAAPIPEPGTILLLSAAGLVGLRQRNRKRM